MILFGSKNNAETRCAPCEPWAFQAQVPANVTDKVKYRQWRAHPKTEHLVFNASEGINPRFRVSKNNDLRRLHALVADFDSLANDSFCAEILERCAEYPPTWLSRTFSGGVRLVWEFEESLAMEQPLLTKQFLRVAWNTLQPKKLFPNPDEGAFMDLTKQFDVGTSWTRLGDFKLSSNTLHSWMYEASRKASWEDLDEIKIPISVIAAEVDKQFPGKWDGPFEVGARGTAFFDPGSTNPTSSIVAEAGMICFSQAQLFHSWAKIFGASFVRQFQEDKITKATKDVWYDGKSFWRKLNDVWVSIAKDDFSQWLRSNRKFDPNRGEDTSSEVDDAEDFIKNSRRVHGVAPRVYDDRDVIEENGRRLLNISYVKAVQPVEERQEWGVNFPWLASFFDAKISKPEQPYYFGWQQRAYRSALNRDLDKGHAFFVVGKIKQGKTLFSNKIIGGLMGGFSDASAHVAKGSEFNKELFETGVWVIDDGEIATDAASHRRFSEIVKRLVANPVMAYRAMFRDAVSTIWNGRLVVTLNDDVHSLAMIPDLEISMEEKVMVLRFLDTPFVFPERRVLESTILAELPYFGRWILDYEVPAEIVGDHRLGVNSYINPELREMAIYAGGFADVAEIIDLWFQRMDPLAKFGKYWTGSPSSWIAELGGDEQLKHLVSKFTVQQIRKKFITASRIPGSRITIVEQGGKKNSNMFRIFLNGSDDKSPTSEKKVQVSFKD